MPLTRKARTRLVLLVATLALFLAIGGSVWFIQQYFRDQRATDARIEGMVAFEAGDYKTAVAKLGKASARFPNDVELLLAFADARGRVESPFGNHLQRCLNRYVLAVRLCKQQNLSDELLLEALIGRGRLEQMFGQSTRLKDSALEILEIDPRNLEANEYLLQLAYRTGDYLPADPGLVVCGDKTDVEWRDVLRDAGDDSALRWAVELLSLDPTSVSRMGMVADLLTVGESVALQQLRLGETIETTDQLLDRWAEVIPSRRQAVMVLKARGYLRDQDLEAARGTLQKMDSDAEDDPAVLAGAASMLYALGGADDQARASELLSKAESMVSDDPAALVGIARQYWMSGRSRDASNLLKTAVEGGILDERTGVDALALLLLGSTGLPDDMEWIETMISDIDSMPLKLGDRERFRVIETITELLREEPFDALRAKEFLAESMNWRGDVLIGTLLGDLVQEAGLPGVAVQFYKDAINAGREYSAPLNFRLANAQLNNGDPSSSFVSAIRLAGYSPNFSNTILVARAWITLERLGLEVRDIAPGVSLSYDTASDLLKALRVSVADSDPDVRFMVESLAVAAAATEGDSEFARAELERLIADSTNEQHLTRLFGIADRYEIAISPTLIGTVKERTDVLTLQEAVFTYELNALRRSDDRSNTLLWVDRELDARPSDMARRALAIELLGEKETSEANLERAYGLLADCSVDEIDLRRMLRIAELLDDQDLASKVVDLARDRFGESSNPYCVAKGMYALARHQAEAPGSKQLVNEARGELDDLVVSGLASIDTYMMLARLWYDVDSSSSDEAIRILERAIERQPGYVPAIIYLARCLQETQRPDEADSFIQQLYQKRERFTPAQRTMLAGLLVRQGRDAEYAASICEVAERTQAINDLLSCMEVRRNNGELAIANSILDQLAIRPDRSVAVEEAVARRLLRRGQIEAAIGGVERSEIIESDVIRVRMIASLLMSSNRWGEARERLDELVRNSEEAAGVSEVMLAICILNTAGGSEEDDRVIDLMDAVVAANPTSVGMIRRVATTIAGSSRVADRGSKYIEKLRELDIDQAELLELGLQFRNLGDVDVPAGFIARASSIVERLDIPLAWSLYLDILSAAFRNAASKGDFDSIERLSEQLDTVSFDFTQTFSGSFGPLNRRVRTLLLIGDVEDARLAAFESIASIEESLELRDVILLARIDGLLGRYEAVADLLGPFEDDILAAPGDYRFSMGLLLQVAAHLGDVDEAMRIHDLGVQAGLFNENMLGLMRIGENVDPDIAIRIARAVNSRLRDPRDRVSLIGMLLVTSVRTGDEAVAFEINELLASVRDSDAADDLLLFQADCIVVEVLASTDPIRSLEQGAEIIREIAPEIRSKILNYQRLSEAERNAIVAYAFPIAILSNNLVARVADLLLEEGDDPGISAEILEGCQTASEILVSMLPEDLNVLDSRARYLASMGKSAEALVMIGRALAGAPLAPEYLLTQAEILSLAGDDAKALEVARHARIARQIGSPGDERTAEKIEALITRLR